MEDGTLSKEDKALLETKYPDGYELDLDYSDILTALRNPGEYCSDCFEEFYDDGTCDCPDPDLFDWLA